MMAGELLLSAFLPVLFDRLASRELLDFVWQEGLRSNLKKVEEKWKLIDKVLSEAERKLNDRAVEFWLDNLRDLAYDMEDMLDEFAYEALRRRLEPIHDQTLTTKVRNVIPVYFTSLKFNVRMRSKIKGVTSRLEKLCRQRIDLGLEINSGGKSISDSASRSRRESTSLQSGGGIYGRDEDKAKILDLLMSDDGQNVANFHVVSIVGMGGIGKTTLAREVYNDKVVDRMFRIKAWICVSEDFDVLKISKVLLESITKSSSSPNDLNEVHVQLGRVLDGRKFLLVLDDVWDFEYDLWENLKSPFNVGAPGSKIIVTTRDAKIASMMGPLKHYNIKVLSDDDCWSVFMKHALEGRSIDAYGSLESIREKVIEKCRGLPLAARALGGLLRVTSRDNARQDILNSKLWDLPQEIGILSVLRLSYHHLPSHLKRCFAYCSIFPKDYEFKERELILLWIAESFIQPSTNNKHLEDLGSEYFHDLFARSFFQKSNINSSQFVMHDLIHDLAQMVSGDTSFRLEEVNQELWRSERVRHSSYICNGYDGKDKFELFQKVDRLRTFLPIHMSSDDDTQYITNVVPFCLLPKLKKLRVLSLRRYYVTNLPNSIGNLRHLRYLNLSGTMIKNLPKSTSSLYNLQILILRNCSRLVTLPCNMRLLINLRHLDIKGANLLKEMPLEMKELKDLHFLSNFIVGKKVGSCLKDLKYLKFLVGELCVSNLENMNDSPDMTEAILSDMKDLEVLSFEWGSQFDDSRNEKVEKNVLDMLQPHKNLKRLTIKYYGGERFSSWIGDPSFSDLVFLKLEDCEKSTSLPSLGLLGSLKDLIIEGMMGIKSIGPEIYGECCSKPFQSLETLRFENLQEWEYWEPIEENEHVEIFPRLRQLSIARCPKLTGKLPDHFPSLETLTISECAQLVVAYASYPMLCNLKIDGCKEMVCNSTPIHSKPLTSLTISKIPNSGNLSGQGFRDVVCLRIVDGEELINRRQNGICLQRKPQWLQTLTSVSELHVENCAGLVLFPQANFFPNLSSFKIGNCQALRSLPEGLMHNNVQLESLKINGCHSLKFIARDMLPSSLKRLEISDCKNLEVLVEDSVDLCASSSSSLNSSVTEYNSLLKYLYVSDCPSLVRISSTGQLPEKLKDLEINNCSELINLSSRSLPEVLEYLYVYNCSKLESIAAKFHTKTSLRCFGVWNCKNLKSIPGGFNNQTCLQYVDIRNCPRLVSFLRRGLPNTVLSVTIIACDQLEGLPDLMHSLKSLQRLVVTNCPGILSFPREGLPSNLIELSISDLRIYKPLIEWGLHKLTSLRRLYINGCDQETECFPHEEMGMMLPTSLTKLSILSFQNLKYLSSTGFRSLTSLEELSICFCPNLISFPEGGLPSSLLLLDILCCPLLKVQCRRDEGQEWSKIDHIPRVEIDGKFIYDSDEEESDYFVIPPKWGLSKQNQPGIGSRYSGSRFAMSGFNFR